MKVLRVIGAVALSLFTFVILPYFLIGFLKNKIGEYVPSLNLYDLNFVLVVGLIITVFAGIRAYMDKGSKNRLIFSLIYVGMIVIWLLHFYVNSLFILDMHNIKITLIYQGLFSLFFIVALTKVGFTVIEYLTFKQQYAQKNQISSTL